MPSQADVVVVGAGYCGLSAAIELARRGRSVVGPGPSRTGLGCQQPQRRDGHPRAEGRAATLEARYGPLGRRLHHEVEAAFDHIESLVGGSPEPADPTGGATPIECDYERSGQLYLTHGRRGAAALRTLVDEHRSTGGDARLVTGDELVAEAGSTLFAAGMVVERTGGLHPARLHVGLVERARAGGVGLFPNTPAISIGPAGRDGHLVRTRGGEIRAAEVFLATNAYADDVDPGLRDRVLEMDSFIIATEPLDPDLAATVLPTRRMAFNDRNLLWYWRHGPEGRLLFGGRRNLGRVGMTEARDHLYASMLLAHPQLAGTRVDRVWGGRVALTIDRLPHCGRIEPALVRDRLQRLRGGAQHLDGAPHGGRDLW